jgi:taurine--2-oxoglutarate transaminase
MAELAAALRANGVWPFTHFNRFHFVPPCNVSEREVDEGVAALDAALAVADRHSTE